jgi:hypothetical protein
MDTHCYEIRIKSYLGPSTAVAFEDLTIRHGADGETVLTGQLADQAALHGVLMKIRDLGLVLIEVKRIKQENE